MAAQQPARASPERRVAPLSPRYRRNYTTHRGATKNGGIRPQFRRKIKAFSRAFGCAAPRLWVVY